MTREKGNDGDMEVAWSGPSSGLKSKTKTSTKTKTKTEAKPETRKKAIMVIWKLSGVVLLLAWRAAQNHPQHCHLHSQPLKVEIHKNNKTVSTDVKDRSTNATFIFG